VRELVSLLALLLLLLGTMAHQGTRVGSLSNDVLAGGGVNSWLAVVVVGVTALLWRHRVMARVDLFWYPLGMAGVAVAVVTVLARLGVVLVLILVLQSRGQTAFPVIIVIVGSLGMGVCGRRQGRRG
jgi:hypothetical protein